MDLLSEQAASDCYTLANRNAGELELLILAEVGIERSKVHRLTGELECLLNGADRYRVELNAARSNIDALEEKLLTAFERLEQCTRERDEARSQLCAVIETSSPCDGHRYCCADRRAMANELRRVRAERDMLRG